MKPCRPLRLWGACYDDETGEVELYPHPFEDRLTGWVGIHMTPYAGKRRVEQLYAGETIELRGVLWKIRKDTPWRQANQIRHAVPWE